MDHSIKKSDAPLPVDPEDEFLPLMEDADSLDLPVSAEKHYLYKGILKNILPYLGSDESKIVLTQVMVALKLEGILGQELKNRDIKMVNVIKESILQEPKRKKMAMKLAQKLLE